MCHYWACRAVLRKIQVLSTLMKYLMHTHNSCLVSSIVCNKIKSVWAIIKFYTMETTYAVWLNSMTVQYYGNNLYSINIFNEIFNEIFFTTYRNCLLTIGQKDRDLCLMPFTPYCCPATNFTWEGLKSCILFSTYTMQLIYMHFISLMVLYLKKNWLAKLKITCYCSR